MFFASTAQLRRWLSKHHATEKELWIGFYKKASKKHAISYKEALDEALCFGWIDGVRKRLNEESYVQRFSPRKARSYWSVVNTRRAKELIDEKRMAPPGLKAFEARDPSATARYSFERTEAVFDAAQLRQFKGNKAAWTFFEAQPPSYRRLSAFFVVSAKKPETRMQRLEKLIAASARGRRLF